MTKRKHVPLDDPRVEALRQALLASYFCLTKTPDGTVNPYTLERAAGLVYRLTYQTLPGGRTKDGESNGMDYGWSVVIDSTNETAISEITQSSHKMLAVIAGIEEEEL